MRRFFVLALAALLAGCARADDRPTIVVQRFLGKCGAAYGNSTDVAKADTECGILTTYINRIEAENPDVRIKVNVVAWPGYPQLAPQLAPPEARAIVALMRQLNAEGLTTKDPDFPAATAAFTQGMGGIFAVGTWMLGPYDAEAAREGSPLKGHYAAAPFPQLWGMAAPFTGGHAWVVPAAERSPLLRQCWQRRSSARSPTARTSPRCRAPANSSPAMSSGRAPSRG
jgi:ABC-type glycerol-3-phosphate transport system substrate-binding protein